jgi:hypothetical protein
MNFLSGWTGVEIEQPTAVAGDDGEELIRQT